jgi:hypothetical protein
MEIRILRYTKDDKRIELTITTNAVAHSILSDNPYLRDNIIEAIYSELTKFLRFKESKESKENEKTINQNH